MSNTLPAGSSVTVTLLATEGITLDCAPGVTGVIEAESGVEGSSNRRILARHTGGRAFYGPYAPGGTVKVSAVGGNVGYEVSRRLVGDPAEVGIGLNPEMFYTAEGKSFVPAEFDTGQPIIITQNPAIFANGGITTEGLNINGERFYLEAPLQDKVTRMGCKFKFTGADLTDTFLVLVAWLTSRPAGGSPTPAAGVHLVVAPSRIRCNYYDVNLANETQYFDWKPERVLLADVEYSIEWFIVGDVFTIIMPNGLPISVTNTGIQPRLGRFPAWEVIRTLGSRVSNVVITKMWASDKDQESAGLDLIAKAANKALPNVVGTTAGPNSTLIPVTNTAFLTGFEVAANRGPSGRALIELTGAIVNMPASTSIVCTFEVLNAAGSVITSPSIVLPLSQNAGTQGFTGKAIINLEGSGAAAAIRPAFRYVGTSQAIYRNDSTFPWTLSCTPIA